MLHSLLVSFVLFVPPVEAAAPDTVVVCPESFRAALEPWLEYRQLQGRSIAMVSNTLSAEGIRAEIRRVAKDGKLRFIVLVGDADPAMERDPELRARCTPTHYERAKINIHWGSPPHLATDNWYADLDDDGKPDVAIGRLTADSPAELATIVRKTIAYEQSTDFGPWRSRINLVAGVGGFGALADGAIELGAKSFITDHIPAPYSTTMTYASWRSPYCPDPTAFHQITLDRLNEGCLIWCYIGHGMPRFVDDVHVPGGDYPILSAGDTSQLQCTHGAPIAIFLACFIGAFDAGVDCMAEDMLRREGGPVAIIGGSRVTMPYAMSVMSTDLMDECFTHHVATIGEALLAAKRRMMDPQENNVLLDMIAKAISPVPTDLAGERAEHVQMFNLIGDPLLQLRYPHELKLDAPSTARPGETITVTGQCDLEGVCTVELVTRRDRLRFKPPARAKYDPSQESLAEYQRIYDQANDPCWASRQITLSGGQFQTALDVPADANGPCHVRVFVQGENGFASGAANVQIQPAAEPRLSEAKSPATR